jgi:Tol biopolymer transport system component
MFVTPSPTWHRVAMVVSPAGLTSDVTQLVLLDPATGRTESLTDGQTSVWSPVWSADGSSLFYVSNASGSADLWEHRFDEDGNVDGAPTAVSSGVGMRDVALSRDGHRLAYSQGRKVAHLWRVPILPDRRAAWADATQITFDQAFVEFADLSADGQRLAVSSDRAGSVDLWVLPAAGGEMRQVTSDPGAEWAPRWSPDARTFAFYSMKSGNRDIYTMPAVGGEWRRLTTNPGPDLIPAWSPDGREVVHLAGFDTYATVRVTPVDGSAGREIARTVSAGVYSPDGQQIAFHLKDRLVRRSATGQGEVVELSRTPANRAVWAPDGARLYFVGAGEAAGNLYAVGADGRGEGAVTDLRHRRGTIVSNSLATDGKYLYFSWQEDLGDLWIADLVR